MVKLTQVAKSLEIQQKYLKHLPIDERVEILKFVNNHINNIDEIDKIIKKEDGATGYYYITNREKFMEQAIQFKTIGAPTGMCLEQNTYLYYKMNHYPNTHLVCVKYMNGFNHIFVIQKRKNVWWATDHSNYKKVNMKLIMYITSTDSELNNFQIINLDDNGGFAIECGDWVLEEMAKLLLIK